MGLIICGDCKSKISDQAPVCPKCGRPRSVNKSSRFASLLWIGLFFVAVYGLLQVASATMSWYSSKQEKDRLARMTPAQRTIEQKLRAEEAAQTIEVEAAKAAAAEKARQQAVRTRGSALACEKLILSQLRDPDSAKWEISPLTVPVEVTGDDYRSVHRLRAKNGFGGINLAVYDCRLRWAAGRWQFVSLVDQSR